MSLCGDNPTTIDKLNYYIYIKTLKEIVLNTNIEETPLTIGIHGAWGSGKTSLMLMLQKDLNEDIKSLWFNAWEYDKTDNVWTALFQNLINEMDSSPNLKKLKKIFVTVVADLSIKGLTKGYLSLKDIEKYYKKYDEHVEHIQNLRLNFEEAIEEYVGKQGKYVIFIDDLDRCLPERAVEILEAIKLFLGAKHCIFIIGVDKDVIWKGIERRYSSKNQDSLIKGKDYVEKIIQLPFNIPPSQREDISSFIQASYGDIFNKKIDNDILNIISSGMEPNPRKMKRFINLYNLLIKFRDQNIINGRIKTDAIKDDLLAKFLVIQFRWEEFSIDLTKYYNSTGTNLINDMLNFEILDDEKKSDYINSNPLIEEYDKYLNLNYFGLRNYLKNWPTFDDDISAYIHLSQTTSVEETGSHFSSMFELNKAIESIDENERIKAITHFPHVSHQT